LWLLTKTSSGLVELGAFWIKEPIRAFPRKSAVNRIRGSALPHCKPLIPDKRHQATRFENFEHERWERLCR
jgi:hypothetical protein